MLIYRNAITDLFCRIPLNVRDIVYCTGVSLMDEDVWEFIWMKFHSTTAVSEKKILLEALTCSDDRNLLNRYKNIIYMCLTITNNHFNICGLSLELWSKCKNFSFQAQAYCLFKQSYVFALMCVKIGMYYVFSLLDFPMFIGSIWNPIILAVTFVMCPLFKYIDQADLTVKFHSAFTEILLHQDFFDS